MLPCSPDLTCSCAQLKCSQVSLCIRIPYGSEPTAHARVCSLLLSCYLQNKNKDNFGQAEFSEPALSLILTMSTLKHRQKFFLHHSILRKYRAVPRGEKLFLLGQRRGMSCLCAIAAQQNKTKPVGGVCK